MSCASFLLISLAVGYGVLVLAKREAKPLNKIGQATGWFIMVVSLVGLVCTAAAGLCRMCHARTDGGMKGVCLMPPLDGSQSQQPVEKK